MWAFFAIAEKKIAAASGAEVADKDVLGAKADFEELRAVGFAQIEEHVFGGRLVAGRHHVEPLQRVGLVTGAKLVKPFGSLRELRLELDGNLRADFVAAAADGRADGSEQVRGPGAELHVHLADGLGDDALERAAPSGVDGGDGALFGVHEENGDAVGGLHEEKQAGAVRYRSVAAAGCPRRIIEEVHDIGVDLFERDKLENFCAESRLQTTPVFQNIFFGVPIRKTEIQHFLAVERAYAAGPRAKAVNQPGNPGKCGHLEDSQVARCEFGPVVRSENRAAPLADAALCPECFRGGHGSTSIIGEACRAERGSSGGVLIIGMGVDIAEVNRIQAAIERHGEPFLRRLYTEKERNYCEQFKNKFERYAGRFAAKEAAMKALGTGWRRGVRWVDLEVVREKSGRPTLALSGEAAKIAKQLGVKHIALSITHTETQALAQVIFES